MFKKEITIQEENALIQQYLHRIREELLFPLYAWLNLRIKNKAGEVQRFLFNKLQRKLWSIIKQLRKEGKPIRLYFIKSRQTGSTTFFIALIFFLTTLWKNRNAIIIAHDDESSESLGEKFQNYLHRSNKLLIPSVRKTNRKEVWFATTLEQFRKTGDIGLDNHIDNSTANKSNLGRSYTYQYALLSEFGLWEESGVEPKATLNALFNSIPRNPESMIIIETTAKGEGFAKDFWEDKFNGFTKVFISWIADDTYRIDIPVGVYFDLSDSEKSRYGDEVSAMDIIRNEIIYWDIDNNFKTEQQIYHETMCRLAWRRMMIDENCMGDKDKFRQEYPLTPEDAFATTSKSVFPIEEINRQIKANKEQGIKPVCYKKIVTGYDDIPSRVFQQSNYGKLKVFEPPKPRSLYVIGGDGAQGIQGGDPSSLIVLKLPELYEVASFKDIIRPTEFAHVAYYLSKLYNNALLGIEINDKGGFATIECLRESFPDCNLYGKVTLRYDPDKEDKYGFNTNKFNRTAMIEEVADLLKKDEIQIYNEEVLQELKVFIKHKNGKLAAAHGKHDDYVMALLIAVQMTHNVSIPKEPRESKKPAKFSMDWHMSQQRRKHRVMGRY